MRLEQEWLDRLDIFAVNRLDAHSDHSIYASVEEYKENIKRYEKKLNGIWKFAYAERLDEIEKKRAGNFEEIQVPGHIQMQGHDNIQYLSSGYTWEGWEDVKNGKTPIEKNPVGIYRLDFEVPAWYIGHPIGIRFHGVECAYGVWVNEAFVGYSEDSFTPSEFDLTSYLKPGKNQLEVQVAKWCAGSWAEDQDFLRFSGIFRDVELFMIPDNHLWDLEIGVKLSENLKKGSLNVKSLLHNTESGILRISCSALNILKEIPLKGEAEELATAEFTVCDPLLWSAEEPNCYLLELEVESNGKLLEYIPQKIGFRRFEMRNGLMCLNGKRIVLKGVNRHEFSAEKGRAIGKEEMLADILTMKQNNINAVRTSHYPNQSYFYELCDEYGIYVMDEANLETHGTWFSMASGLRGSDDPYIIPNDKEEWKAILTDRAISMVERDKNHPSILMWSCGNEACGGKVLYDISKYFRKRDGGRLVHYEGITKDRRYPDTSDMESQMYPKAAEIELFLQEHPEKPFLCCEYAHSMGNSNGGLYKYTELAERNPRYQGGFIWDFIDQAVWLKTEDGIPYLGYGGDFGDRPDNGAFSGNGLLFADRSPSPKLAEVKQCYQNFDIKIESGFVTIQNRNLFQALSSYDCFCRVEQDGKTIYRKKLDIEVLPGETGKFKLQIEFLEEPGYYYTITVSICLKEDTLWGKKGDEVAFGQSEPWYTPREKDVCSNERLEVIHGGAVIGIRGADFHILFSRGEGGIIAYDYKGKRLLDKAAVPNFWRAPVENDYGNGMPQRMGVWKLASKYRFVTNSIVKTYEDKIRITFDFQMPAIGGKGIQVEYTVNTEGVVETVMRYEGEPGMPELPEFGMLFRMKKALDQVTWYGRGPCENYEDRKRGCRVGRYHSTPEQELTPYLRPQECGNHTDTRYLEIRDDQGLGLRFEGECFSFSVLPYTPEQIEEAQHAYELPVSRNTILRISLRQMGVGGDDTWGAPVLDEYRLAGEKAMELVFRLYPVD